MNSRRGTVRSRAAYRPHVVDVFGRDMPFSTVNSERLSYADVMKIVHPHVNLLEGKGICACYLSKIGL